MSPPEILDDRSSVGGYAMVQIGRQVSIAGRTRSGGAFRRPHALFRNGHRRHAPDVTAVLADRAVGREPSHARDVEDGCARPPLPVAPRPADLVLTIDIGAVV